MRGETKLAGVGRQCAFVAGRMVDRMRPRRQLGEEKDGNEKEMAQGIHKNSLVDLNEQAFEILTFGKVQCHRMIGRTGQATHNARLASGIDRR